MVREKSQIIKVVALIFKPPKVTIHHFLKSLIVTWLALSSGINCQYNLQILLKVSAKWLSLFQMKLDQRSLGPCFASVLDEPVDFDVISGLCACFWTERFRSLCLGSLKSESFSMTRMG